MMRYIGVLLIMLVFSGCFGGERQNQKPVPDPDDIRTDSTTITLTPVELFKGESAKFQPFLGAMSGAFKLSYEGAKPNLQLDIDIWQNGKKLRGAGSVGDVFFSSNEQAVREVEVIISMETVIGKEDEERIKIGTYRDSGSALMTYSVPRDAKLKMRGLMQNYNPVTFSADETVHVWGVQATSKDHMITGDFSPEAMNRLEWAVIFTLRSK
ncbi:hypothetical protein SY83_05275 [Paenibacillus swuensis]|uniref:Uncharacterized protein n=1 Tax=Paenibacillus swuensis TaxID=1178515 RepID=A0A172TFU0_9BACL|nr:hypothetical protein [Paenibacillus swuensis]ANE45806.1 hypothetical protein SY83_05275 [Paenibacillus swuensis]